MIVAAVLAQMMPLPVAHHANNPTAAAAAASPPDSPAPRYGTGNKYALQGEGVHRVSYPGLGDRERVEGMCFGVLVWGCIACRAAVELAAGEGHRPSIPEDRHGHQNSARHREHERPEVDNAHPGKLCRSQGWSGSLFDRVDMLSVDQDTSGLGKSWYLELGRLGVGCLGCNGGPVDKDVSLVCKG